MKMEVLYIGLVLHFVGDYLLQNDWMATNKQRSWLVAFIHALIYSMPFIWIIPSGISWVVILSTHLIIDRLTLAKYWIMLMNWNRDGSNFGYAVDKPKFIAVWLLIIVDNTFHIIINSLSLYYL